LTRCLLACLLACLLGPAGFLVPTQILSPIRFNTFSVFGKLVRKTYDEFSRERQVVAISGWIQHSPRSYSKSGPRGTCNNFQG